MKYIGKISVGLVGCDKEFEFEIDEEDLKTMSEDDIEKEAREWMMNEIDWCYFEKKRDNE